MYKTSASAGGPKYSGSFKMGKKFFRRSRLIGGFSCGM